MPVLVGANWVRKNKLYYYGHGHRDCLDSWYASLCYIIHEDLLLSDIKKYYFVLPILGTPCLHYLLYFATYGD